MTNHESCATPSLATRSASAATNSGAPLLEPDAATACAAGGVIGGSAIGILPSNLPTFLFLLPTRFSLSATVVIFLSLVVICNQLLAMSSIVCSAAASRSRTPASKVDTNPNSAYECIGNPTSTTRPDDVLQVGLEEQCVPLKLEAVGQLERRLMSLHSAGGIRQLRAPLRILQIIAELPENDAEAGRIRQPP